MTYSHMWKAIAEFFKREKTESNYLIHIFINHEDK